MAAQQHNENIRIRFQSNDSKMTKLIHIVGSSSEPHRPEPAEHLGQSLHWNGRGQKCEPHPD